ncbi:27 kDa antigen Cfp30B [Streptomyces sp. YIM 130001]|uniref:VOC family protein n=1 Tax=Streptomyces sp. YIM 130001 TaxID=2259644 RepID=UPI000E64D8EC|nr:VOC family protein [Streptomyces sp. YIM 130001]RII12284.1 27 kDa antigen Cfp30B [Streptomyces sp. YIM 130001]
MLTTRFVTGSLNWTDYCAPDIEAAAEFYGAVLGWEFTPGPAEFGGYGTFTSDGRTVAGGMSVGADMAAPTWSVYFCTPDVDAAIKAVQDAGGSSLMEPMDVADLGRMGILADPQGAAFNVWRPGTLPGLEKVDETGSLNWAELYTDDVAAATAFYSAVGLDTFDVPMGSSSYVTVLPVGSGPEGMFGGIVAKGDDPVEAGGPSHWLPYFAVDDCEATVARAREADGSVRSGPVDIEGVGRVAKLADPYGAKLAVIQPAPRPAE